MTVTAQLVDIALLHQQATEAAIKAESDFKAQYGEPAYCGFAWVNIWGIRANSKVGKEISKFCKKDYSGAFCVWNPGQTATQSMDVKEAGAYAYANVWKAAGFKAYAGSRAD